MMGKEKQIEGIVKAIKKKCIDIFYEKGLLVDDCPFPYTCEECMARQIYNAGYRKQSEAEWEKRVFIIFDTEKVGYRCSSCNTTWDTPTAYCPHCGAKMKGGEE